MSRAWIALGGNRGERAATLARAVDALAGQGLRVLRVSHAYETEPEQAGDGPPFLNAVLEGETTLPPRELLALLQRTEAALGRPASHEPGPRSCDLDLLAYDDVVREEGGLCLPHPRLHRRSFVLVPLCELDVHWRHPALGRTASELLAALPEETGRVRLQGPLPRAVAAAAPAPGVAGG